MQLIVSGIKCDKVSINLNDPARDAHHMRWYVFSGSTLRRNPSFCSNSTQTDSYHFVVKLSVLVKFISQGKIVFSFVFVIYKLMANFLCWNFGGKKKIFPASSVKKMLWFAKDSPDEIKRIAWKFTKTVFPLGLAGYELIMTNSAYGLVGYIISAHIRRVLEE